MSKFLFSVIPLLFLTPQIAFSSPTCSDKILAKGTVQGIYAGFVCIWPGCLAKIILDSGDEFFLIISFGTMDEETKDFGTPGNLVSVDYETRQFWDDHDVDCSRQNYLISARIIEERTNEELVRQHEEQKRKIAEW